MSLSKMYGHVRVGRSCVPPTERNLFNFQRALTDGLRPFGVKRPRIPLMQMNLSVYRFQIPNKIDYCGNISPPVRGYKIMDEKSETGKASPLSNDPFRHLLIVSQWLVFRQKEKYETKRFFFIRRWLEQNLFLCVQEFVFRRWTIEVKSVARCTAQTSAWKHVTFHRWLCKGIYFDFPSLSAFSKVFLLLPLIFRSISKVSTFLMLSKNKSFCNLRQFFLCTDCDYLGEALKKRAKRWSW